jgi:hypothetical protein
MVLGKRCECFGVACIVIASIIPRRACNRCSGISVFLPTHTLRELGESLVGDVAESIWQGLSDGAFGFGPRSRIHSLFTHHLA